MEAIDPIRTRIISIVNSLQKQELDPDVKAVRKEYDRLYNSEDCGEYTLAVSICDMWTSYIKSIKNGVVKPTLDNYTNSAKALQEFLTKKKLHKLTVEDFTLSHFYDWENHMKGNSAANTVAKRVKHFKNFMKRMKKVGHALKLDLTDVSFKERPGVKISLTEEELEAVKNHKFTGRRAEIRDLFVLQCSTGLRISDLKRVDQNIQGNRIKISTQKTGSLVEVPLSPVAAEIMKRYNYSLPKVADPVMNLEIKEIVAAACPESTVQVKEGNTFKVVTKSSQITTHDSIRTFITLSEQRGMSVSSISKIVGKTVAVLLKHYLDNSQKIADTEFEKAWGIAPAATMKIA